MEYGSSSVPRSFEVTLRLPDELSEEQAERLVEIAGKCPVHRAFETRDRGLDRGPRRAGLVDLGLDGRACAITGASRGIGREVARRLCAEGASALLVARVRGRARRGGAAVRGRTAAGRAPGARRHRARSRRANRRGRHSQLRPTRRPGQQRRNGQVAPPRGGARTTTGDEAWELNVMAPLRGDARGRARHGGARLGQDRQRLLDRRQAPLGHDARVLGGQGRRALALAPVRRPLRGGGSTRQRRLPRPDQVRALDVRGRPARSVAAGRAARRAARRRSRQQARSARLGASPRSRRSRTRSSSCARTEPRTLPAPRGALTVAPCR